MQKPLNTETVNPRSDWQRLFEAALQESDPLIVAERFRCAKEAIMEQIEDCFDFASLPERRLLLSALNTISEVETVSKPGDLRRRPPGIVGHAA